MRKLIYILLLNCISIFCFGQADVSFSIERGLFTQAFTLTLSSSDAGATIRYTQDGSEPSATVGTIYSTPISISTTAIVRAVAVSSGLQVRSEPIHTYSLRM